MDKRILIPTDFSKDAMNAIHYALNLFKSQRCDFYFLNVFQVEYYTIDDLGIPEPGSAAYESAKAESEAGLRKMLDNLELHHDIPYHRFHTFSTFNLLSEAIKQHIAKYDVELVVMGTQGTTRTKGVIFGSNTVMAMEKIRECPVLAVPNDVHFSTLREIVFPTNFKNAFKRKELAYLLELAQLHSAAIRILYISKERKLDKDQEGNKQLLGEILEKTEHSFHVLGNRNIAGAITTFVESRNSDMIAFINRKHFFFGSIINRPLVKEIGYEAIRPILALH